MTCGGTRDDVWRHEKRSGDFAGPYIESVEFQITLRYPATSLSRSLGSKVL